MPKGLTLRSVETPRPNLDEKPGRIKAIELTIVAHFNARLEAGLKAQAACGSMARTMGRAMRPS